MSQTLWDRELVIGKCRSSINFQLWPPEFDGRLDRWLSNFRQAEMAHAVCLLNSLLFFPEKMVKHIFLSAVNNLSSFAITKRNGRLVAQSAWQHFFDDCIVTTVTGEVPNPTDSGNLFARYCRDYLGFAQYQIKSNEDAIDLALSGLIRSIIFVDDFVGSGNQFIETWNRLHSTVLGPISFKKFSERRSSTRFFYCPAFCTAAGLRAISSECQKVMVSPGNVISDRYSAIHPSSIVWPDHLRESAPEFLQDASARAGIPDSDGAEDDWRGFHKLALTIAFHHGTPDSTLPIFYWKKNGWHHLLGEA